MLEYFYKQKRTMADFRRGPLGPYFDGLAAQMKKGGFCYSRAITILGRACQFNYFLMERGLTNVKDVTPALIDPFIKVHLAHFRTDYDYGHDVPRRIRVEIKHMFDYLVKVHAIELPRPKPEVKPYSWMLDPFTTYLRRDCGLLEVTIERKRQMLKAFLESLGKNVICGAMKSLRAEIIEAYIKKHLKDNRSNFRNLVSALRGFLQFCARQGYTSGDLSGVIPSVPYYRLVSIPKGMEDSAIESLLAVIPKDSAKGLRDYALMLVLMAYGMRGKQAANLALEDINWARSLIRIRALKGGKETVSPLLQAVGEAIMAYLRHRPQEAPSRELFLSTRAPHLPLTGLQIGHIIRWYAKTAGLKIPRLGAHTLRHSWAIRALAHDAPMKTVSDMLGHRHLDTTFIYSKSNLKALREVVMPWPEAAR